VISLLAICQRLVDGNSERNNRKLDDIKSKGHVNADHEKSDDDNAAAEVKCCKYFCFQTKCAGVGAFGWFVFSSVETTTCLLLVLPCFPSAQPVFDEKLFK